MTLSDLLLQQAINGLNLGAMYALLALGFTLVYGILELINFAHFNVFMIGSFIAMGTLQSFGLTGQSVILTGLPLVGVLVAAFAATMLGSGVFRRSTIEGSVMSLAPRLAASQLVLCVAAETFEGGTITPAGIVTQLASALLANGVRLVARRRLATGCANPGLNG